MELDLPAEVRFDWQGKEGSRAQRFCADKSAQQIVAVVRQAAISKRIAPSRQE
jgi:hypothetical protein